MLSSMGQSSTIEHPITLEVQRVRDRLNAVKGHWRQVEENARVSYSWLSQFARGVIKNPGIDTVIMVDDVVAAVAARNKAIEAAIKKAPPIVPRSRRRTART